MPQLTEDDLRAFAEDYRTALGGSPEAWVHIMAFETLINLLGPHAVEELRGPNWVFGNVFGYGSGLSDDYLRSDWAIGGIRRRVISLAELLYHFQTVEGYERLIESLRTDSIESTVGELEGAKLLFMSGLSFRFRGRSGSKGKDFDVQLLTSDGSVINCEMKSKLEITRLSESTVTRTLKAARKQLPEAEANVILLKLPEAWIRLPQTGEVMNYATSKFFRNTGKDVAAIVFHWYESVPAANGLSILMGRFRPELNDKSTFRDIVKAELIDRLYSGREKPRPSNTEPDRSREWRYFDQIIRECRITWA